VARHSALSSDDLRFFAAGAASPSLAAASGSLDVSRSAVTQRLNQLESRLRCRLLHRTTRHLRMTEEGQLPVQRARSVLEDLDRISDPSPSRSPSLIVRPLLIRTIGISSSTSAN